MVDHPQHTVEIDEAFFNSYWGQGEVESNINEIEGKRVSLHFMA